MNSEPHDRILNLPRRPMLGDASSAVLAAIGVAIAMEQKSTIFA